MTEAPHSYPVTGELSRCPFCGGKPYLNGPDNPGHEYWISCQSCGASSLMRSNYDATKAAWNARVSQPLSVAQGVPEPLSLQAVREDERLACWKIADKERTALKNADPTKAAWLVAFDIANSIKARGYSLPSTHHSAPAMEGELDTVVQLIHKHVDVRDLFDGAQELIGVEDAAKAILSALSSTDPRCTCAAIVNPNIPHARSCPLSSTDETGAA